MRVVYVLAAESSDAGVSLLALHHLHRLPVLIVQLESANILLLDVLVTLGILTGRYKVHGKIHVSLVLLVRVLLPAFLTTHLLLGITYLLIDLMLELTLPFLKVTGTREILRPQHQV